MHIPTFVLLLFAADWLVGFAGVGRNVKGHQDDGCVSIQLICDLYRVSFLTQPLACHSVIILIPGLPFFPIFLLTQVHMIGCHFWCACALKFSSKESGEQRAVDLSLKAACR